MIRKITPLITVEDVDAALPFWTERLGFQVLATVPHGDTTGFAMLSRDDHLLMYQSRASVEDDLGPAGAEAGFRHLGAQMAEGMATLFIEVETLEAILPALEGVPVVVPRRTTFYGMDEIFVQAPCGTLVGLAARVGEEA